MQTDSHDYEVFLERKYHPLRGVYLNRIVYPRYVREFIPGPIYDFGCGMGAFLEYCRLRKIPACGIDSNPHMVRRCQEKGLKAQVDDIVKPVTIDGPIRNIICDNVLEHLSMEDIGKFLKNTHALLDQGGVMLVVVPNRKGYASDPTHVTFLDAEVIAPLAKAHGYMLAAEGHYPFPRRLLGDRYVFNMTVLRLVAQPVA